MRRRIGVALTWAVVLVSAASCTPDAAPGAEPTTSALDFCAEAEHVSGAITEFNASQSQTFDDAAAAAAEQVISEARRVAQLAEQGDMAATFNSIADSVQVIVDHVTGPSEDDLNATREAASEYLRLVQEYQTLLATVCRPSAN